MIMEVGKLCVCVYKREVKENMFVLVTFNVCLSTTSQISPDGPHPVPTNKKERTTKAHYDNKPPPPPHTHL